MIFSSFDWDEWGLSESVDMSEMVQCARLPFYFLVFHAASVFVDLGKSFWH